MENTIAPEIDGKQILKEERKVRNKYKKEVKKLQKQKEKEQQELLFRMQPQGSNVSLVTPQFATYATSFREKAANCDVASLKEDDFPLIGEKRKHKPVTVVQATEPNNEINMTKRISQIAIHVDLVDLINNKCLPAVTTKPVAIKPAVYNGNSLDSTMPERKRGKHREFPKEKKPNKFKEAIIQDNVNKLANENPPPFIYCDNSINEAFTAAAECFVTKLVGLQEKMYKRDPVKGKIKKRFVVGFHEIKKFIVVHKIKLLIIASDIKITKENDTLHNAVKELIDIAKLQEVTYMFALKRRKLGKLALKFLPVSCIGVINYDGAGDEYGSLKEELLKAREEYGSTSET